MEGFTIQPVRISEQLSVSLSRSRPRMVRVAAVLCLLLVGVISYSAIHVHGSAASLEETPLAPHHCLLCVAAHLPLSIHAGPSLTIVNSPRPAAVAAENPGSYESSIKFPFCTRPPPQA